MLFRRENVLHLLIAGSATLFLTAQSASAQQRIGGIPVRIDAKGFRLTQIQMAYLQQQAAARAAAAGLPTPTSAALVIVTSKPEPTPVLVTISVPAGRAQPSPDARPAYVDLRGPDGSVRTFPLEGGLAAIRVRQTVVRPGERLTLHLYPAARW